MTHKLLLADDSITIQRVIELTFSGEDIEVLAVGDGEQAIARIPLDRPDIVLADIGMPRRNGYEVSQFVKDRPDLAHIPVLLLAGAFEPVDETRARQVRCDGVLVKPFEPQHVIQRVRDLLQGETAVYPGWPPVQERPEARVPEAGRAASPFFPPAEAPAGRAPAEAPGGRRPGPIDDYFERLDAAFATIGAQATPPDDRPAGDAEVAEDLETVPTLDRLIGDAPPVAAAQAPAAAPPPAPPPQTTAVASVADAFEALLAVEQGEPGAAPPRLGLAADPAISDALVDRVARRVLQQIAPAAARDLVVPIVSEIAERLVREEIARVRAGARAS